MGKKAAEIAALRKQVEALQAEVAALRAVPWWQQQGGGVYVSDVPPYAGFPPNMCGGAAPVPQVLTFNGGCVPPTTFKLPAGTFGAAGCAPQAQTFMVTG